MPIQVSAANAEVSSDTSLSVFTVNGADVSDGSQVNLPRGTTSVVVNAVTTDPAATLDIVGGSNLVTGDNPLTVTVTASDAIATQTYSVNLKVSAVSDDVSLGVFQVNGFDVTGGSEVDLLPGTTSVTVSALATDPGATVEVTNDPEAAAKDASVLYTDVWMSMGDPEAERTEKMKALAPYAVTENLMSLTEKDSIFMHCLPAHRGEEVEASVIDGPKSVIWREAYHRRTTIQALLYHLTRGELKGN